jgi:hypothetical protein
MVRVIVQRGGERDLARIPLISYWAKRLGKSKLHALKISPRGGELFCEDHGSRCTIARSAVIYLRGTIIVPDAP